MKKTVFLLFLSTMCAATSVFSQEVLRLQTCNDTLIQKQADSIRQLVAKDGFSLLREASITMESEYEVPTIVPLQNGSLYHFVFIGDAGSKLFEVRMYDWDENQIIYQKKAGSEGNIIAFSYVPNVSLHHMFNCVQVNKKKKKGLCGYVMLFKKTKA
jgi:hypothetical protein